MKPRRWLLRLLQLVLLVAIAIGVADALSAQFARITWAEVRALTPDPLLLALSTLLLLGVYLAHALLWRRITRDIAGGTAPLRASLHAYFLAGLGRYVPGRLWQLAGLAVLSGRAGLVPSRAVAASVLGQLGFLTTGLVFLGLTLPDLAETVAPRSGGRAVSPLLLASVLLIGAAAGIWLLVATRLGRALHGWAARAFGARMGERVSATLAIADEVEPGRALLWAAGYAASWLLFGAAFLLFVGAFVPVAAEQTVQVAGTIAAAYLVGYLFILAPAGLGARETAMFVLLEPMTGPAAAAVIPVLSRLWFTAAELLPLALLPLLPRERSER